MTSNRSTLRYDEAKIYDEVKTALRHKNEKVMALVSNVAAWMKGNTNPELFKAAKAVYQTVARPSKGTGELSFWKMKHRMDGGLFANHEYADIMIPMAEPLTREDLVGKTVADFGCGPRGSLAWLAEDAHCIGIDVLLPSYLAEFEADLASHKMSYVACTETFIPLRTDVVDVLYTMNALDHVNNLDAMIGEILRILKPGGHFIGAFNLGEEATVTEPQTFDREKLQNILFNRFETLSLRVAPKTDDDFKYGAFFGAELPKDYVGPEILWYCGRLL